MDESILVIGVGNWMRGDDAAGLMAAQRLADMALSYVRVVEHDGEGSTLMELISTSKRVFLVDAAQAGGDPGMIYRFDAHDERLPAGFATYSTHAFGAAQAVEMARALGKLPDELVVYGIEGEGFGFDTPASRAVKAAVEEVVRRIVGEIGI